MGRFESNALAPRYRHHPPRDSRDLDGRLSGSLAAFKFAISAHFKKSTADSFRKDFAPRPILLFQKMRGWLSFVPTKLLGLIGVLAAMAICLNAIVRRAETHFGKWRTG